VGQNLNPKYDHSSLFNAYLVLGESFSNMSINLGRKPMGIYSFEVFHTLPRSTLYIDFQLKSDSSVALVLVRIHTKSDLLKFEAVSSSWLLTKDTH
jgi:hypothetical protein